MVAERGDLDADPWQAGLTLGGGERMRFGQTANRVDVAMWAHLKVYALKYA